MSTRRVADWFAQLNEKMGGDLKKIKVVGQYMIEIWKACGMEGIDSNQVPDQAPARRAVGLWLCRAPAAGWQAGAWEPPSCSGGANACKRFVLSSLHVAPQAHGWSCHGVHFSVRHVKLARAVQAACSMHADGAHGPFCTLLAPSALTDLVPASGTIGARRAPCAALTADDLLRGPSTRMPQGGRTRPRSGKRAPRAPRPQVQFLWASEEINKSPDEYWTLVMDVARRSTLARVRRCSQIMGREDSDDLSAAQIFYPCMQCADIFYLKVRGRAALTLIHPPLHAVRRHPKGPARMGPGVRRA